MDPNEGVSASSQTDGTPCAVCNVVISGPKKYQIHKVDRGFTLGGMDYVLPPLLGQTSEHLGHACHKCYQANMKAKKRLQPHEPTADGTPLSPATKKILRKSDTVASVASPIIRTLPTEHTLVGFKALFNLASLVTSSCSACRLPWVHITSIVHTPASCEYTFTCNSGHEAKWSSLMNEEIPLHGPGEHAAEGEHAPHENGDAAASADSEDANAFPQAPM